MTDPTKLTMDDLIADFDASDADVEAGRLVEGEVVLEKLRAALERVEARLRDTPQRGKLRSR